MGVVLHGLPDDVGDLVVTAVVDALHGVEDTPLHGLQTVLDMGHGALEDDVRGVVEEPVLVHAGELAHAALLLREAVVPALPDGFAGTCGVAVAIGGILGRRSGGRIVPNAFGHRTLLVELLLGVDHIFVSGHQFWIMNCEL